MSLAAQATETSSSHNLYYLNKLTDKSFFVGRANLVTRDGVSDTFFGYIDANYQLTAFIEEEFFYDMTNSELNANWLTFGFSKYWSKNKKGSIKWKLGYQLQSQKFNGEWENRHVLVTGISILSFD